MLSFPFLDKQELFVTKLSFDEFTVERLWLVLNKTKTAKPLKKPQAYSILYVQGKHVFKIDFLLLFIKVSGTFFHFDIGMKEKNAKFARLEIYFLLTFAMCLAHLICVNGPTIQLVLRELL